MDNNLSEELQIIIDLKKNLINEISQLKLNLNSKEYELKKLKSYLYKNCPHKYETDYVSTGLEDIQYIEFCIYCEEQPLY